MSLEGKTILVTGANGFIGQHLIKRLLSIKNTTILGLTRQSLDNLNSSIHWFNCDLQQLTPDFWRDHNVANIDIIFHLAAFIPKSYSYVNKTSSIFSDNLLGTRFLLESLPNSPERIIFSSTVDVYALPEKDNYVIDENAHLGPRNLYGTSKLFCEQLVKLYAIEHNCKYSILRYGHIYGPGEILYRKFIPETIRKLIKGEAPLIQGDGSVQRDYLYIDDAIEATIRAATLPFPIEPLNIVSGKSTTLSAITQSLILLSGKQINPQYIQNKNRDFSLYFNNELMKKILGTWDFIPLAQGLKNEYINFEKNLF